MKSRFVLKVGFMLTGLLIIIYFGQNLKKEGISPKLLSFMGIAPPEPPSFETIPTGVARNNAGKLHQDGAKKSKKNIAWCRTRVRAIEFADGYRVEQSGKNWLVSGENPSVDARKIDFISVEKWFARYCALNVDLLELATSDVQAAISEKISVHYIKGKSSEFESLDRGASFVWEDLHFASDRLVQAFKELRAIE